MRLKIVSWIINTSASTLNFTSLMESVHTWTTYICDMKNGRTRMCFYVDISWIYFSTYTWYELKFKLYIYKTHCLHIWFSIFEKKNGWFFFIITDSVFLHLRSNTIRSGQSRIVLICGSDSLGEIAQMVFEFRQNISDEWRSFLKVNESGSFSTNNRNDIINILGRGCSLSYQLWRIYASISHYCCPSYSEGFPSFRCQVFNGSLHVYISDEVKFKWKVHFAFLNFFLNRYQILKKC